MDKTLQTLVALTFHLKQRPIDSILSKYSEKQNVTVLKFMYILDFHMAAHNLYTRISESSHPKLLEQLLNFRQFETFKFYNYRVNSKIRKRVLRCQYCNLIGPYGCILSHMTINHDKHIGLKMCLYCNCQDLRSHFYNDSIDRCYKAYIERYRIDIDENVCEIVADFYNMLGEISDKLKISCTRNHSYAACKPKKFILSNEKLGRSYGSGLSQEVTIFYSKPRIPPKSIQSPELEKEFERVTNHLYGGNNSSRLIGTTHTVGNDVIEISSDEDGEWDSRSSRNEQEKSKAKTDETNDSIPLNLIKCERRPSIQSASAMSTSSQENTSRLEAMPTANQPSFGESSRLSTGGTSSRGDSDSEKFGSYVAQRISRIRDDITRRRLENMIQEVIVAVEKDDLPK